MDRIRKLLNAEFEELLRNESLLVESPFAETTKDGRGLCEVALGLTRSQLIVASDHLDNREYYCEKNVDPCIESLRLKSIYPLDCVELKVHREKKRKALEARLIDGRAKYYEIGGIGNCRAKSWKDWCSLIRDYGTTRIRDGKCDGWKDKHLYLGPDYEELWDEHYCPTSEGFAGASLQDIKNDLINRKPIKPRNPRKKKKVNRKVSRFAEGINENCTHNLYIPISQSSSSTSFQNFKLPRQKITFNPHFLRGFGPWNINPGDRVSLQSRLTQSLVNIRCQKSEFRLNLSRILLARSISLSNVGLKGCCKNVVLFWTTDYWYKTRDYVQDYRDVREHLDGFRRRSNNHRSTTSHLRKLLKPKHHINLCDISSTILSQQLTLIEREIFTRITINEIRDLSKQRDSRDSSNFFAWIAFSHRITCLLQSEVLRIRRVDERTMIVARLIRTAEKCLENGNLQSVCSIVAALEAPAVYRLKATWSYLQLHHSTEHNAMDKLSKLRAKTVHYEELTWTMRRSCLMIPRIDDFVERLLGLREIEDGIDGDLKILGIRFGCLKIHDDPIDHLASWLNNYQSRAFNYNYPSDSLAREFLLKARYREDCHNFLLSNYLETGTNDGEV